jgi:5-methyltetrahydrofolate--homocysteine methyltransferase
VKRLRQQQLAEALRARLLVLDGAMGTMLQAYQPAAEDFGGAGCEGCNEVLCLTRPEWVLQVHRAYLDAGADIIETNSFQGSPLALDEFGLADRTYALNRQAAALARQAADERATPDRPRFVAGAMGPTIRSLTLRGDVTFAALRDGYYQQARALVEGGVDALLIETGIDTRNIKAALLAVRALERDVGERIPLMISATVERWGTMPAGQSVEALWVSLSHADPLSIGLNCGTGPGPMADHLRVLSDIAPTCVSCHPNAGLPDEDDAYPETPDAFAGQVELFVRRGLLNIVGGCCGTTPAHVRALAQMVGRYPPRTPPSPSRRACFSGIDLVEAEESTRPLIVGERTNVVGSRLFREFVADGKWDEASEIARWQVGNGAQIIDVCLESSDRDERSDIDPFYAALMSKIRVPVMIETSDPAALEQALTWCQGKSLINSISLEDGEGQFARVCPLARDYGAAIVVSTVDEDSAQAQAITCERKLAIAERAVDLLTRKYGIPPEDIIIDPLVFPCAAGDEHYVGGVHETLRAIELIKERIPFARTILGVSAVSFGLPQAARAVVNSVLLYHATRAGLDLAIVNAERLERFASILPGDRLLAEHLLFNAPPSAAGDETLRAAPANPRDQTPQQRVAINRYHTAAIASHFRLRRARTTPRAGRDSPRHVPDGASTVRDHETLDARLSRYVIEGTRDGLTAALDRRLGDGVSPLDIVNGPLMAGMAEVGRLFASNELIVTEVLQSAETMHRAVRHLNRFMEKTEGAGRGTLVLATVKGDVHDIGKNLVDIILSNNGYRVVDLGIRVPPDELIRACRRERPDAVGLSGLLVKSAHQMIATASDLREQGIDVPLIVGGAALSEGFVRTRIAPAYGAPTFYARDAMDGLRIMNELMDTLTRPALVAAHAVAGAEADSASRVSPMPHAVPGSGRTGRAHAPGDRATKASPAARRGETVRAGSCTEIDMRSPRVRSDVPVPAAPSLERHVWGSRSLGNIWRFINPAMLYSRHLGFKGNFEARRSRGDDRAFELQRFVQQARDEAAAFMHAGAVWQFFEAERDGNAIHLFQRGAMSPLHTFEFPRQAAGDVLCLSDYVLDPRPGARDHIGLFVVTAGTGVREHANAARQRGDLVLSHALHALAIETAEATAEWLHSRMRHQWGFPDPPAMDMQDRFAARYRGKRYSFGYPACPNLEDQRGIWTLLRPEEIGVGLTEGFMMDPEASVSALVFHHPDCVYFSVGRQ